MNDNADHDNEQESIDDAAGNVDYIDISSDYSECVDGNNISDGESELGANMNNIKDIAENNTCDVKSTIDLNFNNDVGNGSEH
ncbi:hypothetical protein DPMN_120240 [Dreissena polymorpha]|uniref:Uncharacterized protein n=1 Tax=Dreissena polymorpha TaxID=45954 RepID=A0A9D4GN65_DREPO|nr:hypothetical protein DPMN_120240 [Dreissena polymorpha]